MRQGAYTLNQLPAEDLTRRELERADMALLQRVSEASEHVAEAAERTCASFNSFIGIPMLPILL